MPTDDICLCKGVLCAFALPSSIDDTNFGNSEDVDDVLTHLPENVELLIVWEHSGKHCDAASLSWIFASSFSSCESGRSQTAPCDSGGSDAFASGGWEQSQWTHRRGGGGGGVRAFCGFWTMIFSMPHIACAGRGHAATPSAPCIVWGFDGGGGVGIHWTTPSGIAWGNIWTYWEPSPFPWDGTEDNVQYFLFSCGSHRIVGDLFIVNKPPLIQWCGCRRPDDWTPFEDNVVIGLVRGLLPSLSPWLSSCEPFGGTATIQNILTRQNGGLNLKMNISKHIGYENSKTHNQWTCAFLHEKKKIPKREEKKIANLMKCLKEKKTYHNSLFYSDYKCVRSNSAGLITIVQNLNQGSRNVFAQRQYVMRSSCKLCQIESQLTKTRRIFSYRRSVVRSFACCHVWSSLTHAIKNTSMHTVYLITIVNRFKLMERVCTQTLRAAIFVQVVKSNLNWPRVARCSHTDTTKCNLLHGMFRDQA